MTGWTKINVFYLNTRILFLAPWIIALLILLYILEFANLYIVNGYFSLKFNSLRVNDFIFIFGDN